MNTYTVGRRAILLFLGLLCGCALPYRSPQFLPASADFPGIYDALSESKDKSVDVVMVHGMCTHDASWVTDTNVALAAALGMTLDTKTEFPVAIGNSADDNPSHVAQLFSHKITGSGYTVNTYAILWSPISDGAKDKLCYDVSAGNASCAAASGNYSTGKRVWINRMAKEDLLDNCLADAVYYAGDSGRKLLQSAIREGISTALFGDATDQCGVSASRKRKEKTRPEDRSPLIFITESLGSKMLFDTLVNTANSCHAAGHIEFAQELQRPIEVFMAANQLPILSLADTPRVSKSVIHDLGGNDAARISTESVDVLGPVVDVLSLSATGGIPTQAQRRAATKFPSQSTSLPTLKWVVAFSDPNDVLSYALRPFACRNASTCVDKKGIDFSDVLVSNDWSYFFSFENPYSAHTQYLSRTALGTNQDVTKMIVCGGQAFQHGCEMPGGPR
jgi:hypothetical protein